MITINALKMKPLHLSLIAFLTLTLGPIESFAQIPIFEWASNQQYVGNFQETAITTDSSENVYFTGYYFGNHDFDPGPNDAIEIPLGNDDTYLVKLDPSGNLLWYHTFGTLGVERGFSVFTDSSDNVYVSGRYGGTIDFDPGPNTYNLSPTSGESFGFLASYTPNGDFRWAHSLPGFLSISADEDEVSYDPNGYILVCDRFINTVDFDPGPGTFNMTPTSTSDMYVLKLDLDGNFIWAKQFEGPVQQAPSIKGHSSGNIFVTGYFSGTLDLDPGPGVQSETALGFWDGYVIKLDASGDLIFGKTFGGTDRDEPKEIDIDDQQNMYISGLFRGTADFDPGLGVQNFTSEGDRDPYLLKLDINGDFQWFHNYGGDIEDRKIAVDTDPSGNLYVTGWFYDTLDFEPGPGTTNLIETDNVTDIFVTKLNTNGGLDWVKSFDGVHVNIGTSIYHASSGNFYVCGEYDETVDFNPGFGNAIYTSVGGRDGFNLKYSQCYQSTPVPDSSVLADVTGVCSVDSLTAPTATENCLGTIVGIPDVTFPITAQGTTTVMWTYDAGNGFVATQTQNVIIEDQQAPVPDVASLPNVTATCSVSSLSPPSATDNCSNSVLVSHNATLPILANTTITWTYDDGNGNTSTQTQNVSISPIENSVTLSDGINLTAAASGYSYEWIDCATNHPIGGETNQTYIATSNGEYRVDIYNALCSVTSDCIEVLEVSLDENHAEIPFSVYPNPTFDLVTLELNEPQNFSEILIKDATGRIITQLEVEENAHQYSIDLIEKSGVYFIEMIGRNGTVICEKVLKM